MRNDQSAMQLSNLVVTIYDCIPDATLWQQALDDVRRTCQGYLTTLAVVETERNAARFSVACGDEKAKHGRKLPLVQA
jgi:hypothetical protein